MRYVITQSQFHTLIYKYLNGLFANEDFRKEVNPYVKDGNTWSIEMFTDKGKNLLSYYWYGPGEYDDGTKHNGVGMISVHHELVDTLRNNLTVRESKILDIIADWVSEKFSVDVDESEIHPKNPKPVSY
jgi:hypothetical protein